MALRCPRDQTELTVRDTEGHIGFLCPTCKGAWLPAKYVKSIETTRVFSFQQFSEHVSTAAASGSELSCPSGCGKLIKVSELGATLHRCNSCAGVWFASGEIQMLLSNFEDRYPNQSVGSFVAKELTIQGAIALLVGLLP